MSNELVEKIAIEFFAIDREDKESISEQWQRYEWKKDYRETARLALMTIEMSGTHVVVPVKPTLEMTKAAFAIRERYNHATLDFDIYVAMISARPKVPE